jgi:hypothetical protein
VKRLTRNLFFLLAAAFVFGWPGPASAHIVASRLGDFYAGATHPLTDPRDVVTWGTLGVLAGRLGPAAARWLVAIFPTGLLCGIAVGAAAGWTGVPALADAVLMLGTGAALAAGILIPATVAGLIGFTLAAVRGIANAGGLGPETDRTLFAAGLTLVGYVFITLTMALSLAFDRKDQAWRGIALRACGSWVAAVGLLMAGFAIATG